MLHHLPRGGDLDEVLAATSDLGVAAHPDDLEVQALPGIVACLDEPGRSFTGIVCTSGSGSVRAGSAAGMGDDDLAKVRWAEQCAAADIGRYGAVLGLGYSSAEVRSAAGHAALVDELEALLLHTHPANVYTHNPADKHDTHVAVVAALIKAVRRLPWGARPHRVVGVEAWRDLDWLGDSEKFRLDVSAHTELADQLFQVFTSQLGAGKRYDLAASGRRRANATMADPRAVDDADEVILAMDLSPLIHNEELDAIAYVLSAIDRFRADVEQRWGAWFREV